MQTTRNRNRDRRGYHFSFETRVAVWNKGEVVAGYDPAKYRKDTCGAFIKWSDYGDTSASYGWEIDHIKPVARDGGDELANLQPLHWQNNRKKSDDYPRWYCAVGR